MDIIIQLILGAVGGNVGGWLLKNFSLGPIGNSIAGVVGGGIGGQILSALLGAGGSAGVGGSIASGGVGGIVVMLIVGFIKKTFFAAKSGADKMMK